jgi:hypothetical protein
MRSAYGDKAEVGVSAFSGSPLTTTAFPKNSARVKTGLYFRYHYTPAGLIGANFHRLALMSLSVQRRSMAS